MKSHYFAWHPFNAKTECCIAWMQHFFHFCFIKLRDNNNTIRQLSSWIMSLSLFWIMLMQMINSCNLTVLLLTLHSDCPIESSLKCHDQRMSTKILLVGNFLVMLMSQNVLCHFELFIAQHLTHSGNHSNQNKITSTRPFSKLSCSIK